MNERLITAQSLSVVFNDQPVLNQFNLTVDCNQNTIISGPSGCGKTTLLHCLAGLCSLDEGSVNLLGHDIHQLYDAQMSSLRRNDLGFVYQFHHLLDEFNTLDNVALTLMIQGVNRKLARNRAALLLEKMNIKSQLWNCSVSTLSGGERQRIALARAVIHRPKILFADEPTGCLDQENSEYLMNLLIELNRDFKTTIVMVSHDQKLSKYFEQCIPLGVDQQNSL